MFVKVIKANHDTFWYTEHIGEIFEVDEKPVKCFVNGFDYKVINEDEDTDEIFYILTTDCEIVGL